MRAAALLFQLMSGSWSKPQELGPAKMEPTVRILTVLDPETFSRVSTHYSSTSFFLPVFTKQHMAIHCHLPVTYSSKFKLQTVALFFQFMPFTMCLGTLHSMESIKQSLETKIGTRWIWVTELIVSLMEKDTYKHRQLVPLKQNFHDSDIKLCYVLKSFFGSHAPYTPNAKSTNVKNANFPHLWLPNYFPCMISSDHLSSLLTDLNALPQLTIL